MISPGGSAPRCAQAKGAVTRKAMDLLGSVFAWIEALVLHGCVQEVQVRELALSRI